MSVPEPSGSDQDELDGVSCSSASVCTAVGRYENSSTFAGGLLAEQLSGSGWTIQTVPSPSLEPADASLDGVSCAAPADCVAVGYGTVGSTQTALAEHWDGSSWTIMSTPSTAGGQGQALASVSCTSMAGCTAVGFSTSDAGTTSSLAERWDGTSWTIQPTPIPADATLDDSSPTFNAVSCAAASSCEAVGYYYAGSNPVGLAAEWDGSSWTIQALPAGQVDEMFGVDCAAAAACVGVGSAPPIGYPVGESWDGKTWRTAPTATTTTAGGVLNSLSCATPTACVAIGTAPGLGAVGYIWDGTTWSVQAIGASGNTLDSVSCPQAAWCMTIGSRYGTGPSSPITEIWNGTSWTTGLAADLTDSGLFAASLEGVSCTSSLDCIAVGSADDSSGDMVTMAERWDGRSWTLMSTPNPAGQPTTALTSVSCAPSTTTCMAVGETYRTSGPLGYPSGAFAELWNGASWTLENVPTLTTLDQDESVSCSTSSSCVAVGDGTADEWNGTNWAGQTIPAQTAGTRPPNLSGVSCTASDACTAVGYTADLTSPFTETGIAEVWDGTNWTSQSTPAPSDAGFEELEAVSCPSASSCSAAGYSGTGTSPDPPGFELPMIAHYSNAPVPASISPPSIGGDAAEGQTLTESHGEWSNSPTAYGYQWEDCDSAGANCSAIPAATAQTYTPTDTDVGFTIAIIESATNSSGDSDPKASAVTSVTTPLPAPTSTSPPTITGLEVLGQTLSEANGQWTNSPSSHTYQWVDCDLLGANCSPIAGATSQTYILTGSDLGDTIRVQETAGNDGGIGGPVSSAPAGAVLPLAPSSTAPPTISGNMVDGQTLSEAHGTWSNGPTTFAYQWDDCDRSGATCSAITGATRQTYALTAADVGHRVTVRETASNAGGSGTADSAASAVVVEPPSPPSTTSVTSPPSTTPVTSPTTQTGPGSASTGPTMAQVTASLISTLAAHVRLRAILGHGSTSLPFSALVAGRLTVDWYHAEPRARGAKGQVSVLVASGTETCAKATKATIVIRLTSAGKRLLRHAKHLAVIARARFLTNGTGTVTASRKFTLSYPPRPSDREKVTTSASTKAVTTPSTPAPLL